MEPRRDSNFHIQPWDSLPQITWTSHLRVWTLLVAFLMLLSPGLQTAQAEEEQRVFNGLSKISATCVSCHVEDNRSIIQLWGQSKHYGANVGCYECHQAKKGDPDAFMHKKYLIATLVTPQDCGRCHEPETAQFAKSAHAQAGSNLEGTAPHALATVVQGDHTKEGTQAATTACEQCHGSKIQVSRSGKLHPSTWPNSGIGRINPDGSLGACSACHQGHDFSQVQVRRPEACGRCHQGPAHPQLAIYSASKHGASFAANAASDASLGSPKWIPGQDYFSGPTCATCHMSATMDVGMTHDVGQRIGWDLSQPVSKQVPDADDRREEMQGVCIACHTTNIVENFYEQFDNIVNLYNSKYGEPGTQLMDALLQAGLRSKTAFDDPIEWTWFKLWHQAGRSARQGAAMQSPDHVQWKGFAQVAELFYTQLIPQADALIKQAEAAGHGAKVAAVKKLLASIKNDPANKWMNGQ